jgi:hypothetical protein
LKRIKGQILQDDRSLMVFASSLNVAEVEQIFTLEEGTF